MEKATFAGGCFWCMESAFRKVDGVIRVAAGYTGGSGKDPAYEDYARKGHVEAVEVLYDPSRTTYQQLLDTFWRQIDPTDTGGQFADKGPQYRTAIFYHNREQLETARRSKESLEKSGIYKRPIVTEIVEASMFYEAEEYHQGYYRKNPAEYKSYRANSGRDAYLKRVWGGASAKKSLKGRLTPLQYNVTQECGTERPFDNEYWDNKKEGIYVDIVSGEPLFNSGDKYDSGTGWPSFIKPLEPGNVIEKEDKSLPAPRTEVRSRRGDSHLGHVFGDGPKPTSLRYCINSAALRFIPKGDLEKEGYGKYKKLFKR